LILKFKIIITKISFNFKRTNISNQSLKSGLESEHTQPNLPITIIITNQEIKKYLYSIKQIW
jgi:hypothetical protein